MKNLKITIPIALLSIVWSIVPALGADMKVDRVRPSEDQLLGRYEKEERVFTRLEIDEVKTVSFFHRRKIGEAIVEKDFIRYQFDTVTDELIEHTKRWREGLPASITPVLTQEEAEFKVEGSVTSSKLFFISPESDVFPVEPTPSNPCWVVNSVDGGSIVITIIDAITGEKVGYGVPPPYTAFSLTGPTDSNPCSGAWYTWYENARDWFNAMGYSTEAVVWPTENKVKSHIQSDETALFYELAHGSSSSFSSGCADGDNYENTSASEVETWIASYAEMAFTFLGSCGGMCDTSDDHLSYEFRKGSNTDTVTVGYCGMGSPPCDTDCWPLSVDWQTELFDYMQQGYSVGYAFNRANLAYPDCSGTNDCMRIAGDTTLRVVPVITRCICRSIADCHCVDIQLPHYYVDCDFSVPYGQTLTLDPGLELEFKNDSKIVASGTLSGDGATGQIGFVSAQDNGRGMKLTGQIQVMNGGQIKIYE